MRDTSLKSERPFTHPNRNASNTLLILDGIPPVMSVSTSAALGRKLRRHSASVAYTPFRSRSRRPDPWRRGSRLANAISFNEYGFYKHSLGDKHELVVYW